MSFFSNLSVLFGTGEAKGQTPPSQGSKPKQEKPLAKKPVVLSPKAPVKPAAPVKQPTDQKVPAQSLAAQKDLEAKAKEIIIEAKDQALALRAQAEQEARGLKKAAEDKLRALEEQMRRLEQQHEQLLRQERQLKEQEAQSIARTKELDEIRQQLEATRERVAGLSADEAKQQLFDLLKKKYAKELSLLMKQKEQETRQELQSQLQSHLIEALRHGALDFIPEYTVSSVPLASEEDKGRIIGKAGRNIHVFEQETGVDVDLDSAPKEVRLSCFDPVRREVARITMERLLKDGRVQPSRIEEMVQKVRKELDKLLLDEGRAMCHQVGVYNFPADLMRLLGKTKYRVLNGQNLRSHTLEQTKIGVKLAHELNADTSVVKLACLLREIGRVVEEFEGSTLDLSIKVAQQYRLPDAVIRCLQEQQESKSFTTLEAVVCHVATRVSAARPGAQYQKYEEHVRRLQQFEELAQGYPAVQRAYAMQAGRELLVILIPEKTQDDEVRVLSLDIRDRIKKELSYPGPVNVTVIREARAKEFVK